MSRATEQQSLREIVRDRFVGSFKSCCDKFSGWMVLVVDQPAMRVLSTVIGMYELMEHRITLVESIQKKRAPFPDMGVIYCIAPTEENVNRMIADFSGSGKRKSLYGNSVFVYSLAPFPDHLFAKIKSNKPLMKRIKGFSEMNIDFLAKENRVFHLDMNSCFAELFVRPSVLVEDEITSKLVTVCVALNEYPHIRYQKDSPRCEAMANAVLSKINAYVGSSPNWWYHGMPGYEARDRSTLLLIDRSEDPLSPLMHEFTYQSMVNDLLTIENDQLSVKTAEGSKREMLLNMDDEVWVELKSKHIAEVSEILGNRLRDFLQSNSAGAFKTSNSSMSVSEMANALRELPEYKEVLSKLSQHFQITHDCLTKFTNEGLIEVSELEQTIATGQDSNGKTVKLKEIEALLREALPTLSSDLAMRLLGIFLCSQNGMDPEKRDEFFRIASLSAEQKTILLNLQHLGVTVDNVDVKNLSKKGFFEKFKIASKSQRLIVNKRQQKESDYNDRYVCLMKTILDDLVQENLDIDSYPSVLPLPISDGGVATTVRKKKGVKGGDKIFTGPRKIVFVAGGLCYSEIRAAEEVMSTSDREVILGSTNFLNPTEYIENLRSLS